MDVNILGTRGIPAAHGGFETFAARLAPYLRDKKHTVTVYCQCDERTGKYWEDDWEGMRRIFYSPLRTGPLGTMEFDFACTRNVLKRPGLDLVLGYNTAIFSVFQRIQSRSVMMNMDGIEWKRDKWGFAAKTWFFLNEIAGANLCHVPIADHPEMSKHIKARCFKKPVMIPYGADSITSASTSVVERLGVEPGRYFVSIARIEPENSILELVRAFSSIETDVKCVVLGNFDDKIAYHEEVKSVAGPNVVFPGAIYEPTDVSALRFHALAYLHGHQVGGTNPSLVEALGAGNAVLAHDNRFNRWTAGDGQFFFTLETEAATKMAEIIQNQDRVSEARKAARDRHEEEFQWEMILSAYERELLKLAV